MGTCGHIRVVQSRGGLACGGENDNEYVLRGMTWADNVWLFSDDKEKLVCKVEDIIEELLDQDHWTWSPSRSRHVASS